MCRCAARCPRSCSWLRRPWLRLGRLNPYTSFLRVRDWARGAFVHLVRGFEHWCAWRWTLARCWRMYRRVAVVAGSCSGCCVLCKFVVDLWHKVCCSRYHLFVAYCASWQLTAVPIACISCMVCAPTVALSASKFRVYGCIAFSASKSRRTSVGGMVRLWCLRCFPLLRRSPLRGAAQVGDGLGLTGNPGGPQCVGGGHRGLRLARGSSKR